MASSVVLGLFVTQQHWYSIGLLYTSDSRKQLQGDTPAVRGARVHLMSKSAWGYAWMH